MKTSKDNKGSITIEASLTYPIFLMVVVTVLYIIRIVYTYGLIQHAVAQTVKELSMYTYIYQVSGLEEINSTIQGATADRETQFNEDVGSVLELYDTFMSGDIEGAVSKGYDGTTNPADILKNMGSALVGQAAGEANQQLFELIAKPILEGYIGADSKGHSADDRLKLLRVVNGINGLNLDASRFFEDGVTIDLVVCYTIDPIMPIDIMPSLNLMNRAYARGMSGKNIFHPSSGGSEEAEKEDSVWDMDPLKRGKVIQERDGTRNLPDQFPTYSAFDPETGTATATVSIDITRSSYQNSNAIKNAINQKCADMENYKTTTWSGTTVEAGDIKKNELVVYIPSSTGERQVDRSIFDKALREIQRRYPDIHIVAKEID